MPDTPLKVPTEAVSESINALNAQLPFLEKSFYDNTISEWALSLFIIVGSFLIGKIIYWVFSNVFGALTKKTKNTLDDLIIDLIEEPIVAAIIATGTWFALAKLTFPKGLDDAIRHSYAVVISLLVAWLLVRLFEALYRNVLLPWADKTENDLDDQLMPIFSKGVKMTIWILAVIIGLNNAGYNVGTFIAGLGIGGLALAMAAKDTVANIFGGVTIFTDKPFRMNDRIKVAGHEGTVLEIGVRSTRLKTLAGRVVTMPNSKFSDAPVENVSMEPSRKIVLNLGLTYDTTPEKMKEALETLQSIAAEQKTIEEDIVTSFNGFGDFAMNILFIYYITKGEDIAQTQTDINMAILTQFNEKKLEFAFPTQTIHNIKAN